MRDVSVVKAIYEYTSASLASNVSEMQAMGMLQPDPIAGVPRDAISMESPTCLGYDDAATIYRKVG